MYYSISLECVVGDCDDPTQQHVKECGFVGNRDCHLNIVCPSGGASRGMVTVITDLLVKRNDGG